MSNLPDWTIWPLAAAVCALFVWYFWHVATTLVTTTRQMVELIQNWPQTRRGMAEAEAQSGGRYPLWFRMVRVALILAMVALLAVTVWVKFT